MNNIYNTFKVTDGCAACGGRKIRLQSDTLVTTWKLDVLFQQQALGAEALGRPTYVDCPCSPMGVIKCGKGKWDWLPKTQPEYEALEQRIIQDQMSALLTDIETAVSNKDETVPPLSRKSRIWAKVRTTLRTEDIPEAEHEFVFFTMVKEFYLGWYASKMAFPGYGVYTRAFIGLMSNFFMISMNSGAIAALLWIGGLLFGVSMPFLLIFQWFNAVYCGAYFLMSLYTRVKGVILPNKEDLDDFKKYHNFMVFGFAILFILAVTQFVKVYQAGKKKKKLDTVQNQGSTTLGIGLMLKGFGSLVLMAIKQLKPPGLVIDKEFISEFRRGSDAILEIVKGFLMLSREKQEKFADTFKFSFFDGITDIENQGQHELCNLMQARLLVVKETTIFLTEGGPLGLTRLDPFKEQEYEQYLQVQIRRESELVEQYATALAAADGGHYNCPKCRTVLDKINFISNLNIVLKNGCYKSRDFGETIDLRTNRKKCLDYYVCEHETFFRVNIPDSWVVELLGFERENKRHSAKDDNVLHRSWTLLKNIDEPIRYKLYLEEHNRKDNPSVGLDYQYYVKERGVDPFYMPDFVERDLKEWNAQSTRQEWVEEVKPDEIRIEPSILEETSFEDLPKGFVDPEPEPSLKHDYDRINRSFLIKKFFKDYYWVIAIFLGFLILGAYIIFRKRQKYRKLEKESEAFARYCATHDMELENEGKHRQKRGGKEETYQKGEEYVAPVKTAKKAEKAMKYQENLRKKTAYEEMVSKQEDFARQLGYSLSGAGLGREFKINDRRIPMLSGAIEPEKLLNYDTALIRISSYEGEFHPQKNRHAMIEQIRKLAELGNQFQRPILISVTDGQVWYKLKNQSAGDLNQACINPEIWRQRARALKIDLNDEQLKLIANSPRPEREFSNLCLKALRSKATEGMFYQGLQNEALVGGKILDEEEMRKSLVTTYNNTYYTTGAAFYVANQLVSVAHNIYDLKLKKTEQPGEIFAIEHPGSKESSPKTPLKIVDTCPEGDWAILESPVKGPSLPAYKDDYEGSAFIVSIDANNHVCVAVGPVFKKGNQLWHYIPTLQGHSGLPILHPSGRVLGIHKAYTGVANVGVSINEVLDRNKRKHFLVDLSFQNQGKKEFLNFSYLPKYMVPKMKQFNAEDYPDYDFSWVGEGEILGVVDYNFKERSGFAISDYYLATHEEFGLPNPFDSQYDVAVPSLESIHKDFSKYTRKIDFKPIKPVFNHARQVFKDFIRSCLKDKRLRLLDIVDALHTLNGKASTGWPVKNFIPQKETFFIKFFDTMDAYMQMIINGEDPDVAFDQLGKNELRLLEKLLENKVRSFNAASVYSYFLERIVLGDYVDFMNSLPFFVTHSTSGWSPYYGNWNELVTYLHKPREGIPVKVYDDIDFGKWDSSLMPILFQTIFEVLEELYSGEDLWIAHILFAYILKHIFAEAVCVVPISPTEALVIMIFRGNKSGILCTFRFNCDLNTFGHFYSVNEIQYSLGMTMWTYKDFEMYMAWVSCGDDFSFSVMITHTWFDMDGYIQARERICMFPESYRVAPVNNLTFAGCDTITVNGVACPKTNVDRMIFNVAIVKTDMPLADYIQKLDNLIRISVFSDTEFVIKLIKFRDSLIRRFYSVDGVASVAQGVATLHEAMAMHFYVYEGADLIEDQEWMNEMAFRLYEDIHYQFWYWSINMDVDMWRETLDEFEAIEYIVEGLNQCGVAVIDHLHKNNANIVQTEFKYHGNYCGPGWSAGKHQASVDSEVPSIDKLDEACREHDKSYANNEELDKADFRLAEKAWSEDKLLSTVIYLQGKLREIGLMTKGNKGSKKAVQAIKKVEKKLENAMSKTRYIPPRFNKKSGRPMQSRRRARRPQRGGGVPVLRGGKSKSRPTKITRVTKDTTTAIGTDYAATVAAPSSGNEPGALIATIPISPEAWEGTRLAQTSNMFEKWDINHYRFDYVPTAPTTTAGTLIMFIDPDPSDSLLVTGENLLKKARSARFAIEFHVSERASLSFRPEKRGGDRYTSFDDSERFSSFGNLFIISMTTLANDLVCGTLHVDYSIKFYHPLLETFAAEMSALYHMETGYQTSGANIVPLSVLNTTNPVANHNDVALSNNVVEFNGNSDESMHVQAQLTFKEAGVFRVHAEFLVESEADIPTAWDNETWIKFVKESEFIYSNTSSHGEEIKRDIIITKDLTSVIYWFTGSYWIDFHISTPGTTVTMHSQCPYERIQQWAVISYSITKLARIGPSDVATLSMKNLTRRLDKLVKEEQELEKDREFIGNLRSAVKRLGKTPSTPNGGKQLTLVDLLASLKV